MYQDISTIFVDFDGVLCHGRFFSNLAESRPDAYEFMQQAIFQGPKKVVNDWMRGALRRKDICQIIASGTGMKAEDLDLLLTESISLMPLDQVLLDFLHQLKRVGYKLALVTDNMDVFSEVTVPLYKLDETFSAIVNSAPHGTLKSDNDGGLFKTAMSEVGEASADKILLIDDSAKARIVFESLGGKTYPFTLTEDFIRWTEEKGFIVPSALA